MLEKTPITTGAITVTVSENRFTRAATDRYLDVPIVANDVENPNSTTFVYVTNYGYTFRQWEDMYR